MEPLTCNHPKTYPGWPGGILRKGHLEKHPGGLKDPSSRLHSVGPISCTPPSFTSPKPNSMVACVSVFNVVMGHAQYSY